MSKKYYDEKINEFHEHKLGQITIDVYAKRFMELSMYVPYLKDEKVRMQCFLSGFPPSYQDIIYFYKSNTLEDTIRKSKCCYNQSSDNPEPSKDWKKIFHLKVEISQQRGKRKGRGNKERDYTMLGLWSVISPLLHHIGT